MYSTIASRSARAASRHSTTGTALLVGQRLCITHDLVMWNRWALVGQSLLHFCSKPCVVGLGIGSKTGWQCTLFDNTCKQDAHRIRNSQAEVGELFRRRRLELIV